MAVAMGEDLSVGRIPGWKKLYFIWYFDDVEGYGIEVMGQMCEEALPKNLSSKRFAAVVNWSFGHGTEARDFRRAWGEYVAERTQRNQGTIPADLLALSLRFAPEREACYGDAATMKKILQE